MMKKERAELSMESLLECVRVNFNRIKDSVKKKVKYSDSDCLLSGMCMFYLKLPSLLQFTELNNKNNQHNMLNLYNISNIPSDTHFRVRLDNIEYGKHLQYTFDGLISKLQRAKILKDFQYIL